MTAKKLPHDHGHMSEKLKLETSDSQTFGTLSELFRMLGDEKRVQIFWLLCHCEECVINIAALLEMSSPAVSHHLKLLKNGGLIISRREGKEVYYTAAKTPRSQALHGAIEEMIELPCPADESFKESVTYDSQVQIIDEVHKYLTEDLSRRPTIEELALSFHINQTTLKSTFKRVFGKPIATYMKEYRIRRAAELIEKSDRSISEISAAVGYENQSKFTQAFKDVFGILPKDYRKSLKNN